AVASRSAQAQRLRLKHTLQQDRTKQWICVARSLRMTPAQLAPCFLQPICLNEIPPRPIRRQERTRQAPPAPRCDCFEQFQREAVQEKGAQEEQKCSLRRDEN